MRFSQLQLNVIPALCFVTGAGVALFGDKKTRFISTRKIGTIMLLASAPILVDYSIAF